MELGEVAGRAKSDYLIIWFSKKERKKERNKKKEKGENKKKERKGKQKPLPHHALHSLHWNNIGSFNSNSQMKWQSFKLFGCWDWVSFSVFFVFLPWLYRVAMRMKLNIYNMQLLLLVFVMWDPTRWDIYCFWRFYFRVKMCFLNGIISTGGWFWKARVCWRIISNKNKTVTGNWTMKWQTRIKSSLLFLFNYQYKSKQKDFLKKIKTIIYWMAYSCKKLKWLSYMHLY